jgi:hypothetical protein
MSVSSLSSPTVPPQQPPQAPPQQPSVSTDTNKPQTQETQTNQAVFQTAKTGDDAAAEKQASRPPLPPGQGTRVDQLA